MNKKWVNSLLVGSMALSTLAVTNVYANPNAGPTNWAIGGTATATDSETQFPASNAIDGNPASDSRWATNQNKINESLTVVLKDQKVQAVNRIKITFEDIKPNQDGGQTNIRGFKIEAKKEGQDTFTEIYKKESGVTQVEDITLDTAVNTNTLKLTILSVDPNEWQNNGVSEFEVYAGGSLDESIEQTANVNHMRQATVTASSREADLERLDAKYIKDGNRDSREYRWSSKENTHVGEWVKAVFAKATKIEQIDFYLFERDVAPMPSNIKSFDIVYTDEKGTKHTVPVTNDEEGQGYKKTLKYVFDKPIIAKDITLNNFVCTGDQYPNISIYEVEVYSNKQTAVQTLDSVVGNIKGGTIAADENQLALPTVPEGFEVEFNGADFEQIVDANRNVHHPLVDKEVKISYNVTEKATKKVKNTGDLSYTVKGTKTVVANKNAKPVVIPEIQEWYSDSTAKVAPAMLKEVIYNDASLKAIVDEFIADYKDFTGITLTAKQAASAQAGAFFFEKTADVAHLGNEGYAMDIQADRIIVKSNHVTGNMYAMQTIHQMYKEDKAGYKLGQMQDYPRFKTRGLLLDVARKPVSLEMMKEITRTMRYYKMNDFQPHLSDNLIFLENYGKLENENEAFKAYEAFRLETSLKNDKGESPTAKDYSISKADFKKFIHEERALGMKIVPEIDVPAHATSFTKVWPELAVKNKVSPLNKNRPLIDHFDLTKPEARDKIEEIFDDYTKGENPTFDSETTIHIGADEFLANYTSYRTWLNEIVPHVKATNPVRMWGGLSWIKDDPITQINPEAIENVEMNLWSVDWADGMEMYNMGYKLINTLDRYGYMVPNGGFGRGMYGDLLNTDDVFNNFEANRVGTKNNGYQYVPAGDDQMLGAAFAIWNDNIDKLSSGLTESDLYWRFFDALPVYAEKTWAATGKEKGTANNLKEIAQTKGTGPNTNPYYQEDKKGEFYEKYDFENGLEDSSENDRDLDNLTNAKVEEGALHLGDETSYVNTPIEQLGNGNSLSFDIKVDQPYKAGDIIFEETSPYGTHDIRIMPDGRLGFTREIHEYFFDYKLPVGEKVNIEIVTKQQKTELYVNGKFVSDASGRFFHNGMVKKSGIKNATFALPLERIGSQTNSIAATIDNVEVTVAPERQPEVVDQGKEKWTATAETETLNGGEKEGEIVKAFDEKENTHWHSDWKHSVKDKVPTIKGDAGTGKGADGDIWTEVNFNEAKTINSISFTPRTDSNSGYVTKASLYVKNAPDSQWKEIAIEQEFANDGSKKTFEFDRQEVVAFKFVAHESNDGWVTVSEFDAINIDDQCRLALTAKNGKATVTDAKDSYVYGENINVMATPDKGYVFAGWYDAVTGEKISDEASYTFKIKENTALEARFEVDPSYVDKDALNEMIASANKIDATKYTEESVAVFNAALTKAKEISAKDDVTQEQVNIALNDLDAAIKGLVAVETTPDTKPEEKPDTKPEVKPETKPETTPESKPAGDKSPVTGDNMKVSGLFAAVSLAVAGIFASRRTKKDSE